MRTLALIAALLLAGCVAPLAQNVTVNGAVTPGNCASFFSTTQIKDSGVVCGAGGGGVTSFSSGNLAPLFSTSVATPTTTPAQTFTLTTQANNVVFAGPNGGGPLAPTFRALVAADIPPIPTSGITGTFGPAVGGTGLANPTAHSLLQAEGASNFNLLTAALAGNLVVDQGAGFDWAAVPVTGDCTLAASGALTCTKSNGVLFGTAAFQSFAAPPAIGGTSPNAGAFTSLTVTGGTTHGGPITVNWQVITSTPYPINNATDYALCNRQASAVASTYNLPTTHNVGDTYVVKDCKGDDSTNNITVATTNGDLIDTGASPYVMKNSNTSATPIFLDRAAFSWSGNASVGWIVN